MFSAFPGMETAAIKKFVAQFLRLTKLARFHCKKISHLGRLVEQKLTPSCSFRCDQDDSNHCVDLLLKSDLDVLQVLRGRFVEQEAPA